MDMHRTERSDALKKKFGVRLKGEYLVVCQGAISAGHWSVITYYSFVLEVHIVVLQSLAIAASPLLTVATSFPPTWRQGCAGPPTLLGKVFGRAYN